MNFDRAMKADTPEEAEKKKKLKKTQLSESEKQKAQAGAEKMLQKAKDAGIWTFVRR